MEKAFHLNSFNEKKKPLYNSENNSRKHKCCNILTVSN